MKKLILLLLLVASASFVGCSEGDDGATDGKRRCAAITKDGTQCKRNAQEGSNYCWQHQP